MEARLHTMLCVTLGLRALLPGVREWEGAGERKAGCGALGACIVDAVTRDFLCAFICTLLLPWLRHLLHSVLNSFST